MKVVIELTPQQVKGLKAYLHDTSSEIDPKITNEDVKAEIRGLVDSALQTGSVWDYIQNS